MIGEVRSRSTLLFVGVLLAALTFALLAAVGVASSRATVWLCKPGVKPDYCAPGLSTTIYDPTLMQPLRVIHPHASAKPPVDCFYVYPTVSDEKTGNSDLTIQGTERSIALYQASRYSQYCNVYAPMYRQVTLAGIGLGKPTTKPSSAEALNDVITAFKKYLKNYNHGRGFVLIGHSQGSFVLRALIAKVIDPNAGLRKQLVSAILLGGNVVVEGNTGIGGDFNHIPACRSKTQLGCVIAFSTFDQPAPSNSLFGRPVALAGKTLPPNAEVLCTNPASLGGGSGLLDTISPSKPFAPHSSLAAGIKLLDVTFPEPKTVYWAVNNSYSAGCVDSNGAHVLMIKARNGAPTPHPSPDATWGLHLLDANIALGNLVRIVKAEGQTFSAKQK